MPTESLKACKTSVRLHNATIYICVFYPEDAGWLEVGSTWTHADADQPVQKQSLLKPESLRIEAVWEIDRQPVGWALLPNFPNFLLMSQRLSKVTVYWDRWGVAILARSLRLRHPTLWTWGLSLREMSRSFVCLGPVKSEVCGLIISSEKLLLPCTIICYFSYFSFFVAFWWLHFMGPKAVSISATRSGVWCCHQVKSGSLDVVWAQHWYDFLNVFARGLYEQ